MFYYFLTDINDQNLFLLKYILVSFLVAVSIINLFISLTIDTIRYNLNVIWVVEQLYSK